MTTTYHIGVVKAHFIRLVRQYGPSAIEGFQGTAEQAIEAITKISKILDQLSPGNRIRLAGTFLVARERDDDVGVIQHIRRLHGLQCVEHDDVTALHVVHTRAVRN